MWKELIDNKKAFIFDLDGTSIDSMWVWNKVDIDFFKMHGIPFPDDYQKNIEGLSMHETAVYTKERCGIKDDIEDIVNCWNRMAIDKYSHEVELKPGFRDFISYLKSRDKKLGLATSNTRKLCMAALDAHGISDYFDSIITSDEKSKGKPDPGIYLLSAKRLDTLPDECVAFEDLNMGILAAKNAGMKTVTIWDKYSSDSWDEKVKLADINIKSYTEIMDEIYKS